MIESISAPDDLAPLSHEELDQLAQEIRDFLIAKVSKTGGHLGPNLGVVELTIAIHRTFNSPKDVLLFEQVISRMFTKYSLVAQLALISYVSVGG